MRPTKGMKTIPVQEAVGTVLGHDLTRIVPGRSKGPAFRRGHVIRPEDIPGLLQIGKDNIYVFDLQQGFVHEDEAARRIAVAAAGPGLNLSEPSEGKITLTAAHDGLLSVDVDALRELNSVDDMVFATLHGNQRVRAGQAVAGTRVVPLVIEEEKLKRAESVCARGSIIRVKAFRCLRVGMVTTGSEVYHGRIQDGFGPVVREKFHDLGSEVFRQILVSDDEAMTAGAIRELLDAGAEMIVATGGMSVDPDDRTPSAIRSAGARVVTYGAPVLPGAMFLLAFIGEVPVLGLPGCVMYHEASIFDLIVPRLLAGDTVTKEDIVALGHGGFCSGCAQCRFPICPFGKGR